VTCPPISTFELQTTSQKCPNQLHLRQLRELPTRRSSFLHLGSTLHIKSNFESTGSNRLVFIGQFQTDVAPMTPAQYRRSMIDREYGASSYLCAWLVTRPRAPAPVDADHNPRQCRRTSEGNQEIGTGRSPFSRTITNFCVC
jgi:hypothetical protein